MFIPSIESLVEVKYFIFGKRITSVSHSPSTRFVFRLSR